MGAKMNNGGQDQGDDGDREGHLYQDQINAQQHPTPVFEHAAAHLPNAQFTAYPHANNYHYPHYNQPIYHGQHFYTHPGYAHTNFHSSTVTDNNFLNYHP